MFYETMEDVLPDMKLIIDDGSGVQKVLPLESFVSDMEQTDTQDSGQTDAQ